MNTIIFATNNDHKVTEVRAILKEKFRILSLKEAGIEIDIPEPYDSIEENACEKARVIHRLTGKSCFGEDTGLEVEVLNGEPGVKSARYAGEEKSFDKNIEKLLVNLANTSERKARFRTVVCLMIDGKEYFFEGICEGQIIDERRGEQGFGYDPVFIPQGSEKTFAQMTITEKNSFSHRRKAMDKLVTFLNTLQ